MHTLAGAQTQIGFLGDKSNVRKKSNLRQNEDQAIYNILNHGSIT
jgi:hypothetical protein